MVHEFNSTNHHSTTDSVYDVNTDNQPYVSWIPTEYSKLYINLLNTAVIIAVVTRKGEAASSPSIMIKMLVFIWWVRRMMGHVHDKGTPAVQFQPLIGP